MAPLETLRERIARVVGEEVHLAAGDPTWPDRFRAEEHHLRACLPRELVGRIEHCGSTAVSGLVAKPIVDLLVEVTSLEAARARIAPLLAAQGYEVFWRPSWGEDTPPFYLWCIKRDQEGRRTHHLHLVEAGHEHWDWLLFRDFLRTFAGAAGRYADLKQRLARAHSADRAAYTRAKGAFIRAITRKARVFLGRPRSPRVRGREQGRGRTAGPARSALR